MVLLNSCMKGCYCTTSSGSLATCRSSVRTRLCAQRRIRTNPGALVPPSRRFSWPLMSFQMLIRYARLHSPARAVCCGSLTPMMAHHTHHTTLMRILSPFPAVTYHTHPSQRSISVCTWLHSVNDLTTKKPHVWRPGLSMHDAPSPLRVLRERTTMPLGRSRRAPMKSSGTASQQVSLL